MSINQTFVVQLLPSQTGQTLTAKHFDTSNVQVGSDITTGFTELGNGDYEYLGTFGDTFMGTVRFYIGATYQTAIPYSAVGTNNQPILDAITALGSATVTIVSPFTAGTTNFAIRRGDDYNATLANRIVWSSTAWPDLTTATVLFSAKDTTTGAYDLDAISVAVANAGQATQTLRLSLTHTQTQALAVGIAKYAYDIEATIGSSRMTLASGSMTVSEDVADRT